MKFSAQAFNRWKRKRITLVGMSGVGKSYLSAMLRTQNWFHFSGDYRIGSRYLDESIIDKVKKQAMEVPYLRELLRNDWISIESNIKIQDLGPVSSFIGKLGNPALGGVALADFIQRQDEFRTAEIATMYDVPQFIEKAHNIYGYQHFVNDVGGSVCDLDEPGVIEHLAKHTLILYIQATNAAEEAKLISRSVISPKPLYYHPDFLQQHLALYLAENGIQYAAQMDPDDFARWVFPKLFHSRIPRYEAIAKHGYSVTSEEVSRVKNEQQFVALIARAIERES